MEQTYEDLTQKSKCENENSNMDIEGTVIKVELKPQIHKPNGRPENANQEEDIVQNKYENKANDQNEKSQTKCQLRKQLEFPIRFRFLKLRFRFF